MSTAAQLEGDLSQLLDHALALKSHGEKQASEPSVSISRSCAPVLGQGSLDLKYVKTRFQKGTVRVEEFLESKHRYTLSPRTLTDLQPELMDYKRKHGPHQQCFGVQVVQFEFGVSTESFSASHVSASAPGGRRS